MPVFKDPRTEIRGFFCSELLIPPAAWLPDGKPLMATRRSTGAINFEGQEIPEFPNPRITSRSGSQRDGSQQPGHRIPVPLGKTRRPERRRVECRRTAVEDDLGQQVAQRRGVHHPVA